ncbi:MAG: response regulator [Treponema sp.]|jgi:DNA-binding response OmpR family regulator|nr:response regulator [Treponema sp.]
MDAISQKKTIVIVDDNHVSLMSGRVILKDHYRVFTVSAGEKLFQLLESISPDLILLDVVMPSMNGYEVIKQLKSQESSKDIPVIFLSSLDEVENEREGRDLGAVDYLMKPFSADSLLKAVETHLPTASQAKGD